MSNFVPTGKIYLLRNVNIDSSYSNEYYFANTDAQWTFFMTKVFKELSDGTYQRKNSGLLKVPYGADEIKECNYLIWQNRNVTGSKPYFAFVTSIDYENPKTSIIHYQLDVYQTYMFDVTWMKSFVEREHCDRFDSNDKPIVNVELEDLNYGSEYRVVNKQEVSQIEGGDVAFAILGCKKYSPGSGDYSTFATNMNYFIVPLWVGSGNKTFTMNTDSIVTFPNALKFFANDTTYVNTLVSLYITSFVPFNIDSSISGNNVALTCGDLNAITITGSSGSIVVCNIATSYMSLAQVSYNTGDKYANFPSYTESKLYMYPYSFIELTNNRGSSKIIKMEYVTTDNIILTIMSTLSTSNKIAVAVNNYLISSGYNIQESLIENESNRLPILDDYTASYLQSNYNSLIAGNQAAYLTASTELENASRTLLSAGTQANYKEMANLGSNWVGTLSSLLSTNPGGTYANAQLSYYNNEASILSAIDAANTNAANTSATVNANFENDVNMRMAKIEDAKMIPATASQLGGDTLFNYANDCGNFYLLKKTITTEYVDKLTDYFKYYGYKVNKFEVPEFHTRASWNYIKMTFPNLKGNIPMDDLLAFKGIFTNGITLWHGDYVGDYTRNNDEI